ALAEGSSARTFARSCDQATPPMNTPPRPRAAAPRSTLRLSNMARPSEARAQRGAEGLRVAEVAADQALVRRAQRSEVLLVEQGGDPHRDVEGVVEPHADAGIGEAVARDPRVDRVGRAGVGRRTGV